MKELLITNQLYDLFLLLFCFLISYFHPSWKTNRWHIHIYCSCTYIHTYIYNPLCIFSKPRTCQKYTEYWNQERVWSFTKLYLHAHHFLYKLDYNSKWNTQEKYPLTSTSSRISECTPGVKEQRSQLADLFLICCAFCCQPVLLPDKFTVFTF